MKKIPFAMHEGEYDPLCKGLDEVLIHPSLCGSPVLQFNTEIRKYVSVFLCFALAYRDNLTY